jgi:hypothetical protein
MALINVHLKDLTGTIRKTGNDACDHGNDADIWLGEPKDPKQMPRQVCRFLSSHLRTKGFDVFLECSSRSKLSGVSSLPQMCRN